MDLDKYSIELDGDNFFCCPTVTCIVHNGCEIKKVLKHNSESLIEWRDSPVSAIKKILGRININSGFRQPIYFDNSRDSYLEDFSVLVSELDIGGLSGNSHSRLIIGPNGNGKSTFLQALVFAVQKLATSIIAIWMDASWLANCFSPLQLIQRGLTKIFPSGVPLPPVFLEAVAKGSVPGVLKILAAMKLRILLVIDEYHTIFTLPEDKGGIWRDQIYVLSQRNSRYHMVILSGSSPYMRSMCYGHHPLDFDKYPSYPGIRQRLCPSRCRSLELSPISDKNDLRNYIASLIPCTEAQKLTIERLNKDESLLNVFYMMTGGNYSLMADMLPFISNMKTFMYKIYENGSEYKALWLGILTALEQEGEQDNNQKTDDPWTLLRWVNWPPCCNTMSLTERYKAVANGAIVTDHSLSGDRVRFVTPMQAMFTKEKRYKNLQCPSWFDLYSRICLRYPYGPLGTDAESSLRKSMILQDWAIDKNIPVFPCGSQRREVDDYVLKIDLDHIPSNAATNTKGKQGFIATIWRRREALGTLTDASISEQFFNLPMKESPNKRGADIVIMLPSNSTNASQLNTATTVSVVMCRIQLKLGERKFNKIEATEVITELVNGAAEVKEVLGSIIQSTRLYIFTTRECSDGVREVCRASQVTLLDRSELTHVWAPCVHQWAKLASLNRYCPITPMETKSSLDDDMEYDMCSDDEDEDYEMF
eukprot:gene536-1024_t